MSYKNDSHVAFIALGANLTSPYGGPADALIAAMGRLASVGLSVSAVSRFYATPCFPAGAGPDYVNAAIAVHSRFDPAGVLDALHRVENDMGRVRVQRWGERVIDLDLIAMGDSVLPDREGYAAWRDLPAERQVETTPDRLILPHPRLQDRAFVLVPLRDVARDWRHPWDGRSVVAMCDALPEREIASVPPL